jgi:hypothetical protein
LYIQKQKYKGENMLRMSSGTLRDRIERYSNVLVASALALSGVLPLLNAGQVNAAQLTSRKVTISSSQEDVTGVSYTFQFNTPAPGSVIQSMIFQFCDTPLGTCNLPGTDGTPTAAERMDVDQGTATAGAFTGSQATAFSDYDPAANGAGSDGACTDGEGGSGTSTMFCVTRSEGGSEAAGTKTFVVTNVTNPVIPSGNNEEIYVRISTFSGDDFTGAVDSGTVAASIVDQITVTGRVQERLVFCVFAMEDLDGSTAVTPASGGAAGEIPSDCSGAEANEDTNVDIGVIDNTSIARSPVDNSPPASLGNDRFGAAMLNTNASNGVVLTYYPTTASSGTDELRSFRVPGATCNNSGTSTVDQCFIDASSAGETFANGTERFGLQIACVINSTTGTTGSTSNLGAGGTGSGASGTYNTAYSNVDDSIADDGTDNCENVDAGYKFAWDDSGNPVTLISSSTVVDDELVKMRYGATANATTPTGTYTVASTFIATPTY